MKAFLLICLLLASTLFISPSVSAREIGEPKPKDVKKEIGRVTAPTGKKGPAVPCPPGSPYKSCIPSKNPPGEKCDPYKRKCPP